VSKQIKVLVYEPSKPGEMIEIDDELKAMQRIVGGYIEQVHIPALAKHWLFVICNEEGRLIGLPPNRSDLVGTFFVVRALGTEYVSITDADEKLARDLFELQAGAS